jgi:hypothetical protein
VGKAAPSGRRAGSDPTEGGNKDMAAWKMIGFPGAYAACVDEVERHGIDAVAQYFSTLRPAVESVEPGLVGQSETGNTNL